MKILVTGCTGYIGSHTCVELLNSGFDVVGIDNLYNSKKEIIDKIYKITGKIIEFYEGNVQDKELLNNIFNKHHIDGVIHFAGYKAVNESIKEPLMYYDNNINSTISLLKVMKDKNVKNFIFSSSATVYGNNNSVPYSELMKRGSTSNPYSETKCMIEKILEDLYYSDNNWQITILRYFNPIGAHESGLIGEDPNGIPNNLMPYILKVAINELPKLIIFGNDYDTYDGTCIRDYIHVVDLAKGHVAALKHSFDSEHKVNIYNLGSGKGVSVKELVTVFEKINNIKLNYQFGERREGDLPCFYANSEKAYKELNWKIEKSVEDMCRDAYNFAIKELKK